MIGMRFVLLFCALLCGQYCSGDVSSLAGTSVRMVYNNYQQCVKLSQPIAPCMKRKALKLMDRVLEIDEIPVSEGLSLERSQKTSDSIDEKTSRSLNSEKNVALSENVVEGNDNDLNALLWDKFNRFINERSLKMKVNWLIPTANQTEEEETPIEEGRKKKKNKGGNYMLLMKGGLYAFAYKALALLAGKALLLSKLALALALLCAFRKYYGGGGGHGHSEKTTYEIVKTPVSQYGQTGLEYGNYEAGQYSRSSANEDPIEPAGSGAKLVYAMPVAVPKYVTHIVETVEARSKGGRSISADRQQTEGYEIPVGIASENGSVRQHQRLYVPYAQLMAYRNQLRSLQPPLELTTPTADTVAAQSTTKE